VRGEVRVKSFAAAPRAIGRYGPVEDEAGRRFKVRVRGEAKGLVIARLEMLVADGDKATPLADRNQAEALKGLRLYVPRAQLPKPRRGEWYVADLVGLAVETKDGKRFGTVKAVHDFGAGDVVEIERAGTTEFLPFTKRVVPEVDLDAGRLVVDPPATVEAKPDGPGGADGQDEIEGGR
jgi:16S rRNA processing protein RimM